MSDSFLFGPPGNSNAPPQGFNNSDARPQGSIQSQEDSIHFDQHDQAQNSSDVSENWRQPEDEGDIDAFHMALGLLRNTRDNERSSDNTQYWDDRLDQFPDLSEHHVWPQDLVYNLLDCDSDQDEGVFDDPADDIFHETYWHYKAMADHYVAICLRQKSLLIQQLAAIPLPNGRPIPLRQTTTTTRQLPECSRQNARQSGSLNPRDVDFHARLSSLCRRLEKASRLRNVARLACEICSRGSHAWMSDSTGFSEISFVQDILRSYLNWLAIAHLFPGTLPANFALPTSRIECMITLSFSVVWDDYVRPRLVNAGFPPHGAIKYANDLTAWDIEGVASETLFRRWGDQVGGRVFGEFLRFPHDDWMRYFFDELPRSYNRRSFLEEAFRYWDGLFLSPASSRMNTA